MKENHESLELRLFIDGKEEPFTMAEDDDLVLFFFPADSRSSGSRGKREWRRRWTPVSTWSSPTTTCS